MSVPMFVPKFDENPFVKNTGRIVVPLLYVSQNSLGKSEFSIDIKHLVVRTSSETCKAQVKTPDNLKYTLIVALQLFMSLLSL